ncbi:MAG: tetratricopeptide repeat protein [Bryobacterales bacterium]|nr:tetratricopeptide repeat protein [Bryobacterales bacterium]
MAKPVKKKQPVKQPVREARADGMADLAGQPKPIGLDPRNRLLWAIALGLVVACFVVYAQVGSHEFINYDDPKYVIQNPNVNRGLTAQGIAWAFRTFDYYYWQPLTWISHMIDCQLFGLNAGRHHLVNVALHAVNAVLLFLAFWQFTGAMWRSALVAALFAVHPLRVESVAWVAERKDVLSGLFWMLTLLAYGWYVRAPSIARFAALEVAFLCGIMSKPSTVTLPFVLLLLDWWPLARIQSKGIVAMLREKLPMFVAVAAASVLTFSGQHQMGATVSLTALPFWFRIWNAIQSYVRYLGKFLLPVDLGVLYPYGKIPAGTMLACALLLGVISTIFFLRARRNGYLLTGWLWYLGAMVPMSGLAQTGLQAMADRFTYLPMIGLAVLVVWALADAAEHFRLPAQVAAPVAGLLLGVLAFGSFVQTSRWKNSFTLFEHTVAVTADNDVMHLNLAGLYQERGDLEKAASHFESALRIEPNNVEAHFLVGQVYYLRRDFPKSVRHLTAAIRLKPQHVGARKQLAGVYQQMGSIVEARQELMQVLELDPGDVEARARLMMMSQP